MQTVQNIVSELKLAVYGGEKGLNRQITNGYVSDLLSDVMGNANEGEVWITLQTHKNVMAIASLKELAAIILVNNNQPAPDMLEQSNIENIPVLGTTLSTFEIAGKLHRLLR